MWVEVEWSQINITHETEPEPGLNKLLYLKKCNQLQL